ncbi:MAG: hypothetical protein IAF58_16235 [Leptolyngbya sp.]|nr:hypothetical protein [Candidatus Melainabacteria bacterium]
MSTVCQIRRFIADLPPQTIFVTRELLTFGGRRSVDWATSRLVASEAILRLARGVFVRNDKAMEIPPLHKIAEAKARAFGKLIIPTLADLAAARGFEKPKKADRRKKEISDYEGVAQFSVVGCKGNFMTEHGRVTFKSIAPRKFFLHQEKVGKSILAMWHVSEDLRSSFDAIQQLERFSRQEKKRVKELSAWVPSWLHFYLRPDPPRADIRAPWSIFPLMNERPEKGEPMPFVQESSAQYYSSASRRRTPIILHHSTLLTGRGPLVVCSA